MGGPVWHLSLQCAYEKITGLRGGGLSAVPDRRKGQGDICSITWFACDLETASAGIENGEPFPDICQPDPGGRLVGRSCSLGLLQLLLPYAVTVINDLTGNIISGQRDKNADMAALG